MPRVIAIALQKGGVGKTATAKNIAYESAKAGKKVLLIDGDPQGSSTRGLGVQLDKQAHTIYEVLINAEEQDVGFSFAVIKTSWGIDLIPSKGRLAGAEAALATVSSLPQLLLQKAFEKDTTFNSYDYVFLDCPPGLNIITTNFFVAANDVLVPLQLQPDAITQMPELESSLAKIRQSRLNQSIDISSIVCTFYEESTSLSKVAEKQVRELYGDKVFQTVIRKNVKIAESSGFGQPVAVYEPNSTGAKDYAALTVEVLKRYA